MNGVFSGTHLLLLFANTLSADVPKIRNSGRGVAFTSCVEAAAPAAFERLFPSKVLRS